MAGVSGNKILVFNAGSSSLKFGLFDSEGLETGSEDVSGELTWAGGSAQLTMTQGGQAKETFEVESAANGQATQAIISRLPDIATIGLMAFRVVHGGPVFQEPALVTSKTLDEIRSLEPLAPLHNKADVEVIEAAMEALPGVPAIAVFDTAFHRSLPPEAATYGLPLELASRHHVRRYGFHGISYEYLWEVLSPRLEGTEGRLVACHLGNGASVCAIRNGKSMDTSMGMTPLEGLLMGTRSGDLDPSIPLFLQREAGMSDAEVDELLNHQSGLLGISGISPDIRELEDAAAKGHPHAQLALDVFAYRVAKYVGAFAVALGGIDALAFTGGIGEHSVATRTRICSRLGFLGIDPVEGSATSRVPVWVVLAREEFAIARAAYRYNLNGHSS